MLATRIHEQDFVTQRMAQWQSREHDVQFVDDQVAILLEQRHEYAIVLVTMQKWLLDMAMTDIEDLYGTGDTSAFMDILRHVVAGQVNWEVLAIKSIQLHLDAYYHGRDWDSVIQFLDTLHEAEPMYSNDELVKMARASGLQ